MRRSSSAFFTIAAVAFSGCATVETPSARSARQVVSDYVRAVQAHDGARLCAMFTPPLRHQFDLSAQHPTFTCEKTVRGFIGYVDDAGQPEWKGLRLDSIDEVARGDGHASVSFGVVHRIAEYDSSLHRSVVHSVHLEDRLDLVAQDGEWRLSHAGGTLAASGAGVEKPVPARGDTPEHAVRDYLLALSGGRVDPCPIVPETFHCDHPRPRWSADDPSPLWQSAAIRKLSVRTEGDRAVVTTAIDETDVQGLRGKEHFVKRRVRADVRLRRLGGRWRVEPTDAISRHALGLPPEPASAPRGGAVVALGPEVHPRTVIAGRDDDALLIFTRGKETRIRAATLRGTQVSSDAHVVAEQEPSLQFARDPSSGGAVAAWVQPGPVAQQIMIRRIAPSGAPLGPAQPVGVISAGDDSEGGDVSEYLSALAVSRDGHVLVGWSVTAMSSRPRLDGFVVDPSLQRATDQRMLADDPGYGLALTPSPAGWLTAELLADQPDPTQEIPPQIIVGSVAAGHHRHVRGSGWSGIENAGSLGSPSLASRTADAMMVYAHGDRPASVLAQPLTPGGDPIGQPIEVGRVPAAVAGSVRARVLASRSGYRVAWLTPPDRQRAGALTYVDVDPRGRRHGTARTVALRVHETADLRTPHLLLRSLQTQDPKHGISVSTVISMLP